MGWTSYYVNKYDFDRTEEIRKIFSETGKNGSWNPLKIAFIGSTAYVAVERVRPDGERFVYAAVVLTRLEKDGCFFYKEMTEDMGPTAHCPVSVLKLLTPTDNEYANEWRHNCYLNIEKDRNRRKDKNYLGNLPVGSQIKFVFDGDTIIATKIKHPKFKNPIWISPPYRYKTTDINRIGYEVLKRG